MNKKRYLIVIALAIFVFLALFTFGDPLKSRECSKTIEELEELKVIKSRLLKENVNSNYKISFHLPSYYKLN